MEDMEKKLMFLLATSPCISLAGTYGTYARAARDLINNGVTVQRWIPVTERLPENEGVVLVYGSRGGIYTAEFRMFGEYHHWHKLNSKYHNCAPTHWMPLPTPPADMRKGENG